MQTPIVVKAGDMNDGAPQSVIQKMTYRPPDVVPDVPLTATKAVKLAVTRAAQTSVALTLSVGNVREEILELDGLLAALPDDRLIVGVGQGNVTRGVVVCDAAMCAAAVEVQTTGKISANAGEPRPITRADATLIEPFLQGLLSELAATTKQTALDGWTDDAALLTRLESARATGFVLADEVYRLIRVSVEMLGGERQAEVMLALPPQASVPIPRKQVEPPRGNWAEDFPKAVLEAPACLNAVLHRFDLPLHVATRLQVGQLLPLHGCTVDTVRLMAPGGMRVAKARLGQVAGQVAVRVEDGPKLDLSALPPQPVVRPVDVKPAPVPEEATTAV